MLILGFSGIFFIASHSARPDLLLACYWITALYLVSSAEPGKWSLRFLLAGLLMGFSGDVHLNGFLLAPLPFLFWFWYRPEPLRLRMQVAATYLLAVGGGIIFWLATHYWPNSEAFLQQARVFGGQTHGIRVLNLGILGALHGEIQRYGSWFWDARFHRHLFEGLLISACGGWMLGRGDRQDRAMVLVWFGIFILAVLLMANPFGWYLIYSWPLFSLWMARGLFALHQSLQGRWACGLFLALMAGYLINLSLWTGKALASPSYDEISRIFHSTIPLKASVVAGGEWWFALWDRHFTDAQYMHFQDFARGSEQPNSPSGWEKGWRKQRWQFAVAHGDLQLMLDPEVPLAEAFAALYPSRVEEIREARSFSLNHCRPWLRIAAGSTPVLVSKID
jgi:hypothetical protein